MEKLVVNYIWKGKRPRMGKKIFLIYFGGGSKIIFFKKNKVGILILSDSKSCYKATLMKTLLYWLNNSSTNQ